MKLKVAKIRGVESHGMLCSGDELGKSLDKDVFRQGDNMGDVEDVYNYIHKLIGADSIEGEK